MLEIPLDFIQLCTNLRVLRLQNMSIVRYKQKKLTVAKLTSCARRKLSSSYCPASGLLLKSSATEHAAKGFLAFLPAANDVED